MAKWWYFAVLTLIFGIFSECTEAHTMDVQSMQDQMLRPVVKINVAVEGSTGGYGSGVVYHVGKDYSLILTAKHVVANPKSTLQVVFYGEDEAYDAYVLMQSNFFDLAVVRVDKVHRYEAVLSDNFNVSVFTEVYRVGNGLTSTTHVSKGIVAETGDYVLQTDAGVNGGDSGGAIYAFEDGQWKVVGITIASAIVQVKFPQGVPLQALVPVEGIGYAHDSQAIMEFLTSM